MKVLPMTEERRRELLKMAEGLWADLERNELGGFSGINRPFWIMDAFKQIDCDGYAAGVRDTLAMLNPETSVEGDMVLEAARRAEADLVGCDPQDCPECDQNMDTSCIARAFVSLRAAASALADSAGKEVK